MPAAAAKKKAVRTPQSLLVEVAHRASWTAWQEVDALIDFITGLPRRTRQDFQRFMESRLEEELEVRIPLE